MSFNGTKGTPANTDAIEQSPGPLAESWQTRLKIGLDLDSTAVSFL